MYVAPTANNITPKIFLGCLNRLALFFGLQLVLHTVYIHRKLIGRNLVPLRIRLF